MSKRESTAGKLEWVEAGRGLAAVVVVLSHIGLPHIIGAWAVAFFFVLSGFIIAYIHSQDIGHPDTAPHFIWRRLARVLPTYYLVLPIAILVSQLRLSHRLLSLPVLIREILLLPGQSPLLGPAWTLRYELFFYAMFVLLLLNRKIGISILAAWFAIVLWRFTFVGIWTEEIVTAPEIYIHHINLYFFAGMALAVAARRGRSFAFTIIMLAMAAIWFLLEACVASPDPRLDAAALIFLFSGIVGALVWLSERKLHTPRPLVLLGAASYALYLSHYPMVEVLHGIDKKSGYALSRYWFVEAPVQLAVTLGVAYLIYRFYDRPVVRWLNRRRVFLGVDISRTYRPGPPASPAR